MLFKAKKLYSIVAIIVIVFLSLVMLWNWSARRSLPEQSGIINIENLRNSVTIQFNKFGMPSVWAENDHDLFFAMGWQHAADRLFQMELIRRVSQGRLAEIFGVDALNFDQRLRRVGFARKVDEEINDVDSSTKNFLQDYVDGINTFIDYTPAFPPEFLLLGFAPKKWEITDVATIFLYQTWFSHALINVETQNKEILEKFSEELKPFLHKNMQWSPPTVFSENQFKLLGDDPFPLRMSLASNAFAVSAKKSTTGKAIFASDPHLQVNQLPGFWYAMGLHSEQGREAVGITTPGLPFVAMGHNGAISWAFTVAGVDIIDYYSEPIFAKDSLTYLAPSGWKKMLSYPELFYVKDEENPRLKMFYYTRHGVVVELNDSSAIAMHWAGYDFSLKDILPSLFNLNTTKDFETFRKNVTHTGALSANWLYADSSGQIGYQLGVPVPKRSYKNTFSILPGDSAKYDWKGYLTLEESPHSLNPERGWLATCNNQISVGRGENNEIPGFYDPYRIIRIDSLLREKEKYSVADLEDFQMDLIAPQIQRWKKLLENLADRAGKKELALRLKKWDGNTFGNNNLPTLFYLWWENLADVFLGDEIENLPAHINHSIIEALLTMKNASWVDDKRTTIKENWEDMLDKAFQTAYEEWNEEPWEDASTITFKHMLSKSKMISLIFNWDRGPFPYHGSPSTLNANFYKYIRSEKKFPALIAPSMRMIVDFANIDSSSMTLPAGESGNPYSHQYDSQIDFWLHGERIRLPFSWHSVVDESVSELTLVAGEN